MKKFLKPLILAAALAALCIAPASALEVSISAPDDYLFGRPTSDDTIYEWENPNVDRSKNSALIPPGFGTPSSYLPNFGEFLTPNLAAGGPLSGSSLIPATVGAGTVNGNAVTLAPPIVSYPIVSGPVTGFTEVTSVMYYSNGSLGTLKIPSIGLTVGVYEGTDSAALSKGAGHFEGTSIWSGNVALAAHNRGVRNDFGKIHTLKSGDIITLTTVLGTRTYAVASVTKVSVNDVSGLSATSDNQIMLYTCVENQPAYRWCVKGVEA